MSEYTGIVRNLPDAEYRAAPGFGSTALKWFLEEVPAQAKHWIDHPEDAPTFETAAVGQLIHALVLDQPHPFVVKDWDGRTKDGKARAEEVAAAGQVPLAEADFSLARGCAEGALRHPTVRAWLESPGSGEASVFAEIDGVKLKARFDWLPEVSDRRMVVLDFKSALSANPKKFALNAARFEYGVQHGGYLDVLDAVLGPLPHGMEPEFIFVVVDKRPPHLVSLVGLPQMWAQIGRDKARMARQIIAECQQSGIWPDYGEEIHYVDAPTSYLYQSDEQLGGGDINV